MSVPPDNASIWGIVVAGGSGLRFGGPKHSMELEGKPLWSWGRDMLVDAGVSHVVVVGPVPGGVPGGNRRRDSVAAGLAEVPDDVDYVIVHDAARPLATTAIVNSIIDTLLTRDVDGVAPAVPVRDTLKEVDDKDIVSGTLPRDHLVAVQTPQGFVASALRAAHAALEGSYTDDAGMIEDNGGRVIVVPGDPRNLKVTFPEDLAVVRALVAAEDH
ncbi:MAG: 2-C-methyl-D-erythritol 4-phosphate cytidylyltransferase [Acidimicrobiia bacterium]|nr:2-C-methyl-D-erythritol 4-phosphate cytidylyltransferase [Acidimicrobiia bacterium]